MNSYTVLIFGSEASARPLEFVFHLGLAPLVRSTIASALKAIRNERFAAIMFDCTHAEADPVEFVLNVRDVDKETPVLVLIERAATDADRHVLLRLPNTYLVERDQDSKALQAQLEEILGAEEEAL